MACKHKIVLFMVLIALAGTAYAEKLAVLTDVLKPTSLAVDVERFYVVEECTIYIYSMKDFKFLKKFGKAGEGPQEFRRFAIVTPRADDLLINSIGKISFFTKDGEYQREVKISVISQLFKPLGNLYVGFGGRQGEEDKKFYVTVSIFDENLKVVKELFNYENNIQQQGGINPVGIRQTLFYVWGNRIFVEDKQRGVVLCFDETGKELPVIDPKITPRKVTKEDEERYRDFYKNDPRTKNDYEMLKSRIKFPEYFNPIDHMWVTDGRIYIMTFKREGAASEFLIYDTDGKFIKRTMVPFYHLNVLFRAPTDIKDGKLYQIIENDEEEEWELHRIPIF